MSSRFSPFVGPLRSVAVYAALLIVVVAPGCTVSPQVATQAEVNERVKSDAAKMYEGQGPLEGPVTLELAIARSLKYNLDHRLKLLESALSLGITDFSSFEMWPRLLVSAGYNTRNNDSGGTSVGIQDGIVSVRPSTSQTRDYVQAGAEFSWSVLDFGLSYYRAKQNADQYLIAEERRRKLVQNMIQDVRAAYWRALGAQRLAADASATMAQAETALARSREAEAQKLISPALALNYQRALLDAISLLNQRRQDLEFAKHELAAMMSVPTGTTFTLADVPETKLPPVPTDYRALEEMALLQRPELREEDFKKRITADEMRKQYLNIFPNLSANIGVQYNSNDFLYNKNWQQASLGVSWNLLRLLAVPDLEKTQKLQVKVDEARRLALSMAIITQLRVSTERYRLAVEDLRLADQAALVDQRLADYTRASVTARLDGELEAVRTRARAVLGAYQRANAYASAQIAFGRLYNTLGLDPLGDKFDAISIPDLAASIKHHLNQESMEPLKLKSILFASPARVVVHIKGVDEAEARQKMSEQVTQLLERNQVEVAGTAGGGLPLVFTLTRDVRWAVERADWRIQLQDLQGHIVDTTSFSTKIPERSRPSVVEATLVAALTSHLGDVKSWISRLDGEAQKDSSNSGASLDSASHTLKP